MVNLKRMESFSLKCLFAKSIRCLYDENILKKCVLTFKLSVELQYSVTHKKKTCLKTTLVSLD